MSCINEIRVFHVKRKKVSVNNFGYVPHWNVHLQNNNISFLLRITCLAKLQNKGLLTYWLLYMHVVIQI